MSTSEIIHVTVAFVMVLCLITLLLPNDMDDILYALHPQAYKSIEHCFRSIWNTIKFFDSPNSRYAIVAVFSFMMLDTTTRTWYMKTMLKAWYSCEQFIHHHFSQSQPTDLNSPISDLKPSQSPSMPLQPHHVDVQTQTDDDLSIFNPTNSTSSNPEQPVNILLQPSESAIEDQQISQQKDLEHAKLKAEHDALVATFVENQTIVKSLRTERDTLIDVESSLRSQLEGAIVSQRKAEAELKAVQERNQGLERAASKENEAIRKVSQEGLQKPAASAQQLREVETRVSSLKLELEGAKQTITSNSVEFNRVLTKEKEEHSACKKSLELVTLQEQGTNQENQLHHQNVVVLCDALGNHCLRAGTRIDSPIQGVDASWPLAGTLFLAIQSHHLELLQERGNFQRALDAVKQEKEDLSKSFLELSTNFEVEVGKVKSVEVATRAAAHTCQYNLPEVEHIFFEFLEKTVQQHAEANGKLEQQSESESGRTALEKLRQGNPFASAIEELTTLLSQRTKASSSRSDCNFSSDLIDFRVNHKHQVWDDSNSFFLVATSSEVRRTKEKLDRMVKWTTSREFMTKSYAKSGKCGQFHGDVPSPELLACLKKCKDLMMKKEPAMVPSSSSMSDD